MVASRSGKKVTRTGARAATKAAATRDRTGALYAMVGEDVLESLEACVAKLNAERSGPKWTRQDYVKKVLQDACAALLGNAATP